MADDKLNMTQGAEDRNHEDDNTNGSQNEQDNELNDDPEDISPEEFAALNSQMDQLNSALDVLEEQNDMIHAKLVDLLESNREARKQFQEEQAKKGNGEEKRN